MNAPFPMPVPSARLRFGAVRGVDWNDTLQLTSTTLEHGNPVTRPLSLDNTFQAIVIDQGKGVTPIGLSSVAGDILIADAEQAWVQIYVPGLRIASWLLGTWPFQWRLFRPGAITQIAAGTVLITER